MLVFLCISYSYQTVSHALLDLSMGIFEEIEAAMFEDEMSDVKAAILKTAILKVYFKSIMRMKCLFDIYLTYMISLDNFSRTRGHFIICTSLQLFNNYPVISREIADDAVSRIVINRAKILLY